MKKISWIGLIGAVLTIGEFIYGSVKAEKDKEEIKAEILKELREDNTDTASNSTGKESA